MGLATVLILTNGRSDAPSSPAARWDVRVRAGRERAGVAVVGMFD
jgi:hypothetical protein